MLHSNANTSTAPSLGTYTPSLYTTHLNQFNYASSLSVEGLEIINNNAKIFRIESIEKDINNNTVIYFKYEIPKDSKFLPSNIGAIYIADIDLIACYESREWCYWENTVTIRVAKEDQNKLKQLKKDNFLLR